MDVFVPDCSNGKAAAKKRCFPRGLAFDRWPDLKGNNVTRCPSVSIVYVFLFCLVCTKDLGAATRMVVKGKGSNLCKVCWLL